MGCADKIPRHHVSNLNNKVGSEPDHRGSKPLERSDSRQQAPEECTDNDPGGPQERAHLLLPFLPPPSLGVLPDEVVPELFVHYMVC